MNFYIEVKIIEWNKTSMSLQPKQELLTSFPSLPTRRMEFILVIWKEHRKGKTWINIPKNYMKAPETGKESKEYWVNEAKAYGYEIAPVEQVQKTKKWMEICCSHATTSQQDNTENHRY